MKLDTKKIYLIDGPTGTEIERRGGDTSAPLWSARTLFDNPDLVLQIHSDYIEAGADIITTNTFRTQPWTLKKEQISESKARELTLLAVDLVKEARQKTRNCLIAGSIPPLEDCYSPWLVPKNEIISKEQEKHIRNLVDGGIDIFLLETMNTLREASLTFELTKEYADIPVILSFTCNDDGLVLGGDTWESVLNVFRDQVDLISINCSSVIASDSAIHKLINLGFENFGVYPNFGSIKDQIWYREDHSDVVHQYLKRWLTFRPKLVGTCCGAIPEDTSILKAIIKPL